jgi:lysyl endopeptidase
MNIRSFLLTLALGMVGGSAFSQVSQGGEPYMWPEKDMARFAVEELYFPGLDMESIQAYDAVADQYKETPYRFGIGIPVDLSPENSGEWETLDNGSRVWRLAIECEAATSISFFFDNYRIPKGGKLFVYNWDRTEFLGSFDHRNNHEQNALAVGLLNSDKIVIEYMEPAQVAGLAQLHISEIVHGYRAILNKFEDPERGPFGSSGACNINVNCPEGDLWQVEKRSVALIVESGFALCTGSLVNNTANDGTPYFLTANHCLGGNVASWVFYFNHESANCVGNTGPTNQSVSGAVIRASNGGSDFALLELNSTPPENYNVQYVGWDNSDALTVTAATGIHHPSGDVKKICFEEDAPYHQSTGGAAVWWVDQWEDGVTEGGSSGSPLFDQNHRVIGQLYGGASACAGNVNNGQFDYYGRFGVSWDNGNNAATRLRDWLDPGNTGVTFIDGYPEGSVSYALDAAVTAPQDLDGTTICGSQISPAFKIRNMGTDNLTSVTVNYEINGNDGSFNWTGNLAQGEQADVSLPVLNLQNGSNTLVISLSNPNAGTDENPNNNTATSNFTAFSGDTYLFTLEIVLDDYGSETSWELRNSSNTLVYEGGPYADGADGQLVEQELCLVEDCYSLTFFDAWGDGMCCEFGNGGYTMLNQNSIFLFNGGQFGESEENEFCVDPTSILENSTNFEFSVYPNPSEDGVLNLKWNSNSQNAALVEVFDATGRLVKSDQFMNAGAAILNLSGFQGGVYQISLEANGVKMNKSVVLR